MTIEISARLRFNTQLPTDILLQFEAAHLPEQPVLVANTAFPVTQHIARIIPETGIGERIWISAQGSVQIDYRATVQPQRFLAEIDSLSAMPPRLLPSETVQFLFDSRYCPGERFRQFVMREFGDLEGGALVIAMRDWINGHLAYEPGSSSATTTALDSFVERRGVCRDFAHLMVSLARAAGIPARYASVYAPGVTPQDFHAVAEVFLADPEGPGGGWHLVDATLMAEPADTVKIGVGRDAADVSFLTSFGDIMLEEQIVQVTKN